jgi:hypothetical protein
MDNPENPAPQGTQDEEVAIKNGLSRNSGTPGSLDCPFLIATSSSCVPCGAEFSGLSVFDCHFVLCALFSGMFVFNCHFFVLCDEEVAIKNGQSRELCTTGHTKRRSDN